MSNNDVQTRINKCVDYLRLKGIDRTQQELADRLGYSRANVSAAINGNPRYLTEAFLHRFAKAYLEYINEDWLLTGNGEMEKPDKKATRPHIPSDRAVVSAGFVGKAIGSVAECECEIRPVMTPFPWYDFTIEVDGDSMEPELQHGDTIVCRWINSSEDIHPKNIYVVDSAEGAVVKQLSRDDSNLICHSINPRYPDFVIPLDSVLRIARVEGLVRNF